MSTVEHKFTSNKVGETLKNFSSLKKGDLILADRAYGTITSILHCLTSGADYVFRLKCNAFSLYDADGKRIHLNEKLFGATEDKSIEFTAYFKDGKKLMPIRICAIKKNAEGIAKSEKRIKRHESKNQTTYSDESKIMNHYIVIATSISSDFNADNILALYRYRWLIEPC